MVRTDKYLGLFKKNKLIINYINKIDGAYAVRVRYDALNIIWHEYFNSQKNRILKNADTAYESRYLIFDCKGNKVIASNSIKKLVEKIKELCLPNIKNE